MKSQYPKYKYHKSLKPRIVKSEAEESKLGKDWADSPATFGIESAPGKAREESELGSEDPVQESVQSKALPKKSKGRDL